MGPVDKRKVCEFELIYEIFILIYCVDIFKMMWMDVNDFLFNFIYLTVFC